MKQFKFVVAAILLMIGAVNTWAEDVKPAEQPIHVSLMSVDSSGDSDIKIAPADYANGIFVSAESGAFWKWTYCPVSSEIFAAKLQQLGFIFVAEPSASKKLNRMPTVSTCEERMR